MDAAVDAMQRDFSMAAAFGGNADQRDIVLGDHLLVVSVTLDGRVIFQAVLCQQLLHSLRQNIADSYDVQLVVHSSLDVIGGNSAAADQCIIHIHFPQNLIICYRSVPSANNLSAIPCGI